MRSHGHWPLFVACQLIGQLLTYTAWAQSAPGAGSATGTVVLDAREASRLGLRFLASSVMDAEGRVFAAGSGAILVQERGGWRREARLGQRSVLRIREVGGVVVAVGMRGLVLERRRTGRWRKIATQRMAVGHLDELHTWKGRVVATGQGVLLRDLQGVWREAQGGERRAILGSLGLDPPPHSVCAPGSGYTIRSSSEVFWVCSDRRILGRERGTYRHLWGRLPRGEAFAPVAQRGRQLFVAGNRGLVLCEDARCSLLDNHRTLDVSIRDQSVLAVVGDEVVRF